MSFYHKKFALHFLTINIKETYYAVFQLGMLTPSYYLMAHVSDVISRRGLRRDG